MKIVTYNIQFGLGKDARFDLQRVADEVSDADIIALQEVERVFTPNSAHRARVTPAKRGNGKRASINGCFGALA
jgi:endonuclease/exonuclease/phosphatase family metal-dependent hydrolase